MTCKNLMYLKLNIRPCGTHGWIRLITQLYEKNIRTHTWAFMGLYLMYKSIHILISLSVNVNISPHPSLPVSCYWFLRYFSRNHLELHATKSTFLSNLIWCKVFQNGIEFSIKFFTPLEPCKSNGQEGDLWVICIRTKYAWILFR